MTPIAARNPKNTLNAIANNILRAKYERRYPILKVGDKVRIVLRNDKFKKATTDKWSKELFAIDDIVGEFYMINTGKRRFLRTELLKVER